MGIKAQPYTATPAEPVHEVPGVTVRWVIGEADGAPHFAMRIFEVPPGKASPFHAHWFEHEVFILAGKGHVKSDKGDLPFEQGYVVFVPGGETHQFVNDGDDVLRFICVIPHPRQEAK